MDEYYREPLSVYRISGALMRDDRIREEFDSDGPELVYLLECARRLEAVFAPSEWTLERGITLISILNAFSIRFCDGFVIGDTSEDWKLLGFAEAEAVVAAISSEPNQSAEWWRDVRLGPRRPKTTDELFFEMKAEIVSAPGVEGFV
ncbi:MAG: hypothetical protein AAGA54_22100 [Myxococcota bacterium]